MKVIKISHVVLALISGVLLIGYGGMDDSPGAQGIGLLTCISSIIVFISIIRDKKLTKSNNVH